MRHYLFSFILLILLPCGLRAQQNVQAIIDSMLLILPQAKEDTNKVNLLNDISYNYNKISPYNGIKYGMRSLTLATELKWKWGIGRANSCIGANYFSLSDYPMAYKHWLATLQINEELGFKRGIANHLQNIGNIYFSQQDYTEALKYYERALNAYQEMGNKKLATHTYSAIGNVYTQLKNYSRALEYHFMALAIDEEEGDKRNISSDMVDIGSVYNEQGNCIKALEMLLQAIPLKKETGDKYGLAKNYMITGNVYLHIAKYIAAGSNEAKAYGTLQNNLSHAITYLDSAVAISTEIGYLDNLQKNYELLSEAYTMNGDYKKAHAFNINYQAIKDSVFSAKNNANIVRQGLKFDFEKIRMADQQDHAMKLQRQRTFTQIGLAGVVLLIGFSLFVVRNNRIQRGLNNTINKLVSEQAETIRLRTQELADSNVQLASSNKKLVELIQYNSHNIREPLARVMGGMSLRGDIDEAEFYSEVWPEIERSVTDLDNSIKKAIVIAEDAVKLYG